MNFYPALRTALDADTSLATLTDQQVADALNAPGALRSRAIPVPTLLQWTAVTGVRANLENYIDAQRAKPVAEQSPAYGVCLAVQDTFWGAMGSSHVFDVQDDAIGGDAGLLAALVGVGIMTASQKTQLINLLAVPGPSRASLIPGWSSPVQAPDITVARSL